VFNELGKMNWQSFIRTRLSLLNLQEDVLAALRAVSPLGGVGFRPAKVANPKG
jgi:hypothetical protein